MTERAIKQIIDAVRKKHFFARLVLPFWFFVPSLSWQSACFMVVFVASLSWQTIVLMHTKQKPKTHTHQQKYRGVSFLFCGTFVPPQGRTCGTSPLSMEEAQHHHAMGGALRFSSLSCLPFPFPFPSLPCGSGSGFGSGSGCGSGCGCGSRGALASCAPR